MPLFEYVGALHVHSKYSDGSGSVKKIIREAQQAKLDYLILTDHSTLAARSVYQGWHDGMLLVVDEEISPWAGNHYLALGLKREIKAKAAIDARPFVNEVKKQGGVGIIAHPFGETRKPMPVDDRPWRDWSIREFDGLEIWSYMYDWIENATLLSMPRLMLNPDCAIEGPDPRAIAKWDELTQHRRVVGVSGLDAHAKEVPLLNFIKILSYGYLFRTLRNHLLLERPLDPDDPDRSIAMIHDAYRNGACFVCYDRLSDGRGFDYHVDSGGVRLIMGSESSFAGDAELVVKSPKKAEILIIRNGKVVLEKTSKEIAFVVSEPGVYRIEAHLNGRPWIFTNPIYLR